MEAHPVEDLFRQGGPGQSVLRADGPGPQGFDIADKAKDHRLQAKAIGFG
jgi:hypothetical protein